jgi:hypothetical protein
VFCVANYTHIDVIRCDDTYDCLILGDPWMTISIVLDFLLAVGGRV